MTWKLNNTIWNWVSSKGLFTWYLRYLWHRHYVETGDLNRDFHGRLNYISSSNYITKWLEAGFCHLWMGAPWMQIANTNPHRVITACVHRAAIIPRSAAFIFPVLFILRYRALFIQLFPTSPRTIQRTANSQHYFPLCSLITNRGNYAELKQDLNYVSVMLMCNGLESFIMLESLQ